LKEPVAVRPVDSFGAGFLVLEATMDLPLCRAGGSLEKGKIREEEMIWQTKSNMNVFASTGFSSI